MKIELTPSQQDAKDKMREFLKDPYNGGQHFVLAGGPGTGKTFLTKFVLAGYGKSVAAATISHAAKNVLREHIGDNVKCYTLAGLLGMKMNVRADGSLVFKENPNGTKYIDRYTALILDEISMIDDPLYDLIMREAYENDIKIIAMGDSYQLPPVEQDHDSKFFQYIDATLVEPMRFQGPIYNLAQIFREEIKNINEGEAFNKWAINTATGRKSSYDFTLKSGYKFSNNIMDIVEMAADDFKDNMSINHSRILAYKNNSVDIINNGIRHIIYGDHTKQFEEGELVISNSNYRVSGMGSPFIHNGEILQVDSYIVDEGPGEIQCARLEFKDKANYAGHPVYVVTTDDGGEAMKKYNAKVAQLKAVAFSNKQALEDYVDFISQFAQFDYAYAVNLYRAQGSTIENAYVLEGEVMGVKPLTWKQKFQGLYVAVTRPKKNLIIHNKDF